MSLPQAEFFVTAAPLPLWVPPRSAVFACPHLWQSRTGLPTQRIVAPSTTSLLFSQTDLNWQAADPAFGNYLVATNKDYLFMQNTSLSQTLQVTLLSYPEPNFGRNGNLCAMLPPGTGVLWGPITKLGWMQPDGNIYFYAPSAAVQFLPLVFS
jgi:hypothetical protein